MQSLISYYAAMLSLVEMGLGSLLHSMRIPFSGHALSLNQGLILTQACQKTETRKEAITTVNGISIIAAILKSLSPIGKRLTPMLAISMQGFLFSLGLFFLGNNLFGIILGMSFLSVWAFAQPLIFAYLFFGEKLFLAIEKLWLDIAEKINLNSDYGLWLLIGFVGFKILLSWLVGYWGWKYPTLVTDKYFSRMLYYKDLIKPQHKKQPRSAFSGAITDVLNPWIVVSLILTLAFMTLTEKSSLFQIFVYGLRVVAVAWLVFFIMRAFPQKWIKKILNRFPTLAKTVQQLSPEAIDRAPESTELKH